MSIVSTLVLYFRQFRFGALSHNPIAEQQTFSLEPAKSKFPLEISLRRGFGGAGKPSSHRRSPLTRTFAEQKCLVTAKDRRFAARQEDRCTRNKIQRSHKTERECPRNRKHSLILFALYSRIPRISKGPRPFCLMRGSAVKKATSSWRLDTTLLCAAKKNGVEKKDSLAGLCQKTLFCDPPIE